MTRAIRILLLLALLSTGAGAAGAGAPDRLLFVPSEQTREIAVVDATTNSVALRLSLDHPPYQLVVLPDGSRLLASDFLGDRISVFDLESGNALPRIELGFPPVLMQISPDGRTLAVNSLEEVGLWLIDLQSGARRRVEGIALAHNFAFGAESDELYVTDLHDENLKIVEVATGRLLGRIPGTGPVDAALLAARGDPPPGFTDIALAGTSGLAVAIDEPREGVALVDLARGRPLARLELGETPWRVYPVAYGELVIVTHMGEDAVSVVSTTSLEEVARLEDAPEIAAVATGWFESTAFLMSAGRRAALTLDLDTLEVTGAIPLPGTPQGAVTSADGTRLYVSLREHDGLAVIDTRERRLLHVIDDVGRAPGPVVAAGSRNFCS